MVLENLTARYRFPCILDLKVGTRQHGDDATEEKKIRHTKMCASSTSLSLGVRFCGAQVCGEEAGEGVGRRQGKVWGGGREGVGRRQVCVEAGVWGGGVWGGGGVMK